MNKLILAMGAILISHTVFAAEIHQCNVNGSVVFQANPCAGSGGTAGDRVRENAAVAKEKARIDAEKLEEMKKSGERYRAEMDKYNSLPQPYIGMHSGISTKWGAPTTKNVTRTARGTREQWVYRGAIGKTRYLYFVDSILVSISE